MTTRVPAASASPGLCGRVPTPLRALAASSVKWGWGPGEEGAPCKSALRPRSGRGKRPISRGVTQGRFPGGTPELRRGPSQPRPVQRLRGARRVGVAWLVPCLARAVSGDGCPGSLLLGWASGSRGWRAAKISRRGRKRGHHLAVRQAGSRPLPGGKPPSPAAALRSRVPPSRDQPQHPLGWVAEARTPPTAPPTCRAALHGARCPGEEAPVGGGACNPPGPAAYPQAESPRPAPSTRRTAWPAWTGSPALGAGRGRGGGARLRSAWALALGARDDAPLSPSASWTSS